MKLNDVVDRLEREYADWKLRGSVSRVESYLNRSKARDSSDQAPVIFFNASTRIHTLSINAAISLISSWSLRAAGIPAYYAVCNWGMEQCILGTRRDDLRKPPPCKHCVSHSQILFPRDRILWIKRDPSVINEVHQQLEKGSLQELIDWQYGDVPLGALCLPGLRWVLRRHNLADDQDTRFLYKQYLASAASLVHQFRNLFKHHRPRALVIFNGLTFPEAVARFVAEAQGVKVITHEVGLAPYSAFFSHKEATFRELDLPSEFRLSPEREDLLYRYLDKRFQGKYTMAGVEFWPEMKSLPDWLNERIDAHTKVVPIFTNVIFDTSQVHANTLFEDMFTWLNDLLEVIRAHPETLFIIRAHPDEHRAGKVSRESVTEWVRSTGIAKESNVEFLGPGDAVSSYEIIRRSTFVMVYNSSIGLEASIMGAAVLCAGRARYTQIPTVFFPENRGAYRQLLEEFLRRESVVAPPSHASNARRFLYFELYRASLNFAEFLKPYPRAKGMTLLKSFHPERLLTSETLQVIENGIVEGGEFIYQEGET